MSLLEAVIRPHVYSCRQVYQYDSVNAAARHVLRFSEPPADVGTIWIWLEGKWHVTIPNECTLDGTDLEIVFSTDVRMRVNVTIEPYVNVVHPSDATVPISTPSSVRPSLGAGFSRDTPKSQLRLLMISYLNTKALLDDSVEDPVKSKPLAETCSTLLRDVDDLRQQLGITLVEYDHLFHEAERELHQCS